MSATLKNRSFFTLLIQLIASLFIPDKGSAFLAVGTAPKEESKPDSKKTLFVNVNGDESALSDALVVGMRQSDDLRRILFKSVERVKGGIVENKCAESFGKSTTGMVGISDFAENVKSYFDNKEDSVFFIGKKANDCSAVVVGSNQGLTELILNTMKQDERIADLIFASHAVSQAAKKGNMEDAIASIIEFATNRAKEKRKETV